MAPPAFGSAGTYGTGTGNTISVDVPDNVAVNDIIVVPVYIENTDSITTFASGFAEGPNSPTATGLPGTVRLHVLWKRATAADSTAGTYVMGWTNSAYRVGVATRYSGAVTSGSPWDVSASSATSSAATGPPAVTLTTTGADRLLVYVASSFNSGTWTAPTSFTKRVDTAPNDVMVADLAQAAAGSSGSLQGTSVSTTHTAWAGALIPAGASSGLTVRAASGFQSGSATTTPIAITLPAGTTTNDLVYIVVSMNSVLATLTQSAGTGTYTNLSPGGTNGDRNSTGGHTSWVFSRTITAGNTAPSFTIGGTAGKYSWVAITAQPSSGVAAHISLAGPTVESASGTSHTPPTLNAGSTTGLSLLVNAWRAAGNAATAVTTTPPTNWVEPTNGDFSTAVGTTAALRQVAAEVSARTGQTGTITPGAQVTTSVASFGNEYHFFAAEQLALSQTITDSVGILDAANQAAAYSQTEPDPVGILDAATPVSTTARSQTDPVGILDSITQTFTPGATDFSQTVTDLVGLLDSRAQSAVAAQSVTDPVGLLDSAGQVSAAAPTLTDLVGLLDAASQAVVGARNQTDPVGLLDTAGQASTAAQTVTDALGLLDSVGSAFAVTLTDAVGLSDAAAAVQGWAQSLTDAVGLSDATTKDLATSLTDNVGLTDASAKALTTALTDAVGLLDSAGQASVATQALTDAVGLLDSIQASSTGNITATLTDAVGLLDSVGQTAASARSQTDALGLLDSSAKDLTTNLTDAVGLLDTAAQTSSAAQTVTDALGLLDGTQQSTTGSITATITDAVGLSDSAVVTSDLARTATDSLGLTDTRTQLFGLGAVLTDGIGLADATARLSVLSVVLADVLGLSDEVQIQGTSVVQIVLPITTGAPVDLVDRGETEIPEDLAPRGRAAVPVNRIARATVKQL